MSGPEESISLDPSVAAASEARAWLRRALPPTDIDTMTYEALLLALSELVTNAVLHARTRLTATLVRLTPDVVRVEVADRDPQMPVVGDAADDATSGRGLAILGALDLRWGVDPVPGGKTVWVESDVGRP